MNIGQWALTNPAGLLWGLLALPIVALHILKPRRIRATVPAIFLWRQVAKPVTAAKPWQNLTPSWLLVAQVLAALLLAVLMAGPVRLTPLALAEHTIFVVDGSASMQTADGSPDRLADAVDRASELRRQVPDGGEASLVVAGANARALLTRSSDVGAFDDALDRIEPYDGLADFDSAFALAAGLNTGDRPTRVVFVSDGGIDTEDLSLAPIGTRYERIGDSATNRGISRLSVEPSSGGLVVRIAVRHYGGPAATETVRVDVDGVTIERLVVELADESIENLSVRVPPGEMVEVFLESEDSYLLDNRAVGTVARRPEISVLRVGGDNAFLDAALTVIPGLSVDARSTLPESADGSVDVDALGDVDVIIADRVAVPDEVPIPTWVIAPPVGGPGGIRVTGELDRPALVSINPDSPLVSGLDLSEVLLARAQEVTVGGPDRATSVEVVLGGDQGPLLMVVRRPGADVIHQTFALDESTLPLQAAFPVLVERIITELAQAALPPARLTVGERLPVDPRLPATITDPNGSSVDVAPGGTVPVAGTMGFWRVEQDGRVPVVVAVNPPPAESAITPAIDLPFTRGFAEVGGVGAQGQVPLRRWVLGALLAVVAVEWLLARRRVGVGARQWQMAQVLRAAVALALLGGMFDLRLTLPTDRVATVFLIDASDSMGVGGISDGSTFVRDALSAKREAGNDDVAGVVAFGRNARLENVVGDDPTFNSLSVDVDRTATDLSAALRLGAAALPNDARRRLVLLSDGRATTGDAVAEAERLAELGVPVDVVIIEPPTGADAAVAAIDAPSLVQVDEALAVATTVTSEVATDAVITLRRDGELVERRTVSLTPGDNRVVFDDVAASTGVMRYQVDVDAAGDPVTLNNRAYAAVPVSGAETVLVVDGEQAASGAPPGIDAERMVAVLEAAGLPTETVAVRNLPPLDALTQFASIVLVNVNRLDLAEAEVANLTAAVRDLGRGLVTVGGDHTYALGGYRGSDLEELLPVDSEITDPLRRQTVAQVLAIDTSGSMDACHCDEDGRNGLGTGNRIDGGVVKTAIAQAAAAKAIAAMSPSDEVGVLTMDASDQWAIDLQANPSQETIDAGLSQLRPEGPTTLTSTLVTAAAELRESNAALKHIIVFSDGFTEVRDLQALAVEAAELLAEGITVSVVATGEGAAEDLRPIADAGGGRFYPGRNLEQIPDLIAQETIAASRSFVNEGEFLPTVTSNAAAVANLQAAPIIDGYIATTAKSLARVDLRIGPDDDPLLASWQTGLGRVTSWTADGGERWTQRWTGWDGAPDFWATVVKETFPSASDGAGLDVSIRGDEMTVRLEAVSPWDDDAVARVRVNRPDGEGQEVILERIDGTTYAATVPVDDTGVYAVGGSVEVSGAVAWSGIGLSTRSYAAEYAPADIDVAGLERLAELTGGRVDPTAASAFDAAGTTAGQRRFDLFRWFLWFALLAWPVAVAVSRLSWRSGVLAIPAARASDTVRQLRRSFPSVSSPEVRSRSADREPRTPEPDRRPASDGGVTITAPVRPPVAPPTGDAARPAAKPSDDEPDKAGSSSLEQMLERKRRRRDGG